MQRVKVRSTLLKAPDEFPDVKALVPVGTAPLTRLDDLAVSFLSIGDEFRSLDFA